MKHSVVKKVTRRLSLLLLAAATLLIIGVYHTVYHIVTKENSRYATALLGVYVDFLAGESAQKGIPIDLLHTDDIIRCGQYFCDWYDVDYAYVYIPDTETGKVTYLAACYRDALVQQDLEGNLVGHTADYVLTPEELAVWNGEKSCAQYTIDNKYGHEVSTVMCLEDAFGNRYLAGMDTSYYFLRSKFIRSFVRIALIIIAVTISASAAAYRVIQKKVSQPVRLLSQRMQDFITDGKRSKERLTVDDDGTEYAMIASAFNRMADDIDNYVENIHSLTREQEHQQTELDIASRIQQGFLPAENLIAPHYEIHGIMTPARDVGGDLFDYVVLDDTHVLVVIADVSGKGVSAAMFMSVTLTLIRQFAKMGLMPDEILHRTNDTLSENNAAMLFATAFVGIYDSETGTLTYSNAGHNRPYIIGSSLRRLEGGAGMLLGLFEGEQYSLDTVLLDIGETLFLFTDGVSEAINSERQFFGTERLEETLRSFHARHAENALTYASDAISSFSGAAEPYDDITMLTLTAKQTMELSLAVNIREMEKIKAAIFSLRLPCVLQRSLCLSAEESFINICSYAFEGRDTSDERILFRLSVSDRVRMSFEDGGIPYDPLKQVILPEDYDMGTQIGGLGKLISFTIADDVHYEYRDGKNILTLIKYFEEEDT